MPRAKPAKTPAVSLPVVRVAVDMPLPHLDRPFDYLVTEEQSAACVPGCRVRVRFAGQLVDGFALERVEASEHTGRLAFLDRVVSAEPVLAPEIAALARAVADRWAGSFADVVRLAVPPRHATVEKQAVEKQGGESPSPPPVAAPDPDELSAYAGGDALVRRLHDDAPRIVLTALPGDWPATLATCVAATLASGRGVVVVVPDHRDVVRVAAAIRARVGDDCVELTADLGPAERYRRFLAVRRGTVRCVVGTRAAVWAPVRNLGAIVVWDDGDDLHAEPRAPYCHARDVAVLRAHQQNAALVLAAHNVTAECELLLQSGWAELVEPTSQARAAALPAVRATGDDAASDDAARAARLPTLAWRAIRDAVAAGHPALVQVPRVGYQLSLHCAQCRSAARCPVCAGPLARTGTDVPPSCRWCGAVAAGWTCPACGSGTLRAGAIGNTRTAEELGRAFPGVAVRMSAGDHVAASVPDKPAVVVATPGAEPVAAGGYGAAVLLDTWALLGRPDLRAGEEALRRWLAAAALVRPASEGGRVVVVAPSELRPVQALVRWRPRWHAERELEDRTALHLPPAARVAAITGDAGAVQELLELAERPAAAEVLGPVPAPPRSGAAGDEERLIIRVPRRDGIALAQALHAAAAVRSARKAPGAARIEVDPATLA